MNTEAVRFKSRPNTPVAQRLAHWTKESNTGCWEWTGALRNGYGTLYVNRINLFAHRLSYEDAYGPIPAGLQIDHLCRNRKCNNPDHLEAVTPQENNRRGMAPGAIARRRVECEFGHAFAVHGVIRRGRRVCRVCRIAYSKAYKSLTSQQRHLRAAAGLPMVDLALALAMEDRSHAA